MDFSFSFSVGLDWIDIFGWLLGVLVWIGLDGVCFGFGVGDISYSGFASMSNVCMYRNDVMHIDFLFIPLFSILYSTLLYSTIFCIFYSTVYSTVSSTVYCYTLIRHLNSNVTTSSPAGSAIRPTWRLISVQLRLQLLFFLLPEFIPDISFHSLLFLCLFLTPGSSVHTDWLVIFISPSNSPLFSLLPPPLLVC